jgi:hypothetical protein
MMRPQRTTPPGAGNAGDAMSAIAQASVILRQASANLPHGSKELTELNRAIGILNKIAPSAAQIGPQTVTQAQQGLSGLIRAVLGNRSRQMMQQNPQPQPTTPQPGV